MTDREKYLIILDRFYRGRGGSLLTKDESEALDYAISSIKTDLKYDLLYEETREKIPVNLHITEIKKHQSDFSDLESTSKNDLGADCISRDAVLKPYEGLKDDDTISVWLIRKNIEQQLSVKQEPCDTCRHYENGCHWLPSVTPQEPKTGHWITTRTFMHDGEYYCDKCKCDSPNNEKWNYCPNCGAKMVDSQESED